MNPIEHWPQAPDALQLGNNEAHVWGGRLLAEPAVVEQLAKLLSEDEQDRAQRYRLAKVRQQFILARGMLRTILSRYLQCPPAQIAFTYGPHGKPAVAAVPDGSAGSVPAFNMAHSRGLALLAVTANGEVGIDVEEIRPDGPHDAIAGRFFSKYEAAVIGRLAGTDKHRAFYNAWTRKEAILKALGTGVGGMLAQWEVSLLPGEPARIRRAPSSVSLKAPLVLAELPIGTDHVAAIAIEGPLPQLTCWHWHPPAAR